MTVTFEYDGFTAVIRLLKTIGGFSLLAPCAYYVYTEIDSVSICADEVERAVGYEPPVGGVFGRDDELGELAGLVAREPSRMLVVTGPSDCGKSTVLRALADGRPNTVYLSLKDEASVSVDSFVRAFSRAVGARFLQLRSRFVDALPSAGGENYTFRDKMSRTELQKALNTLSDALHVVRRRNAARAARGERVHRPVIVLDEFGTILRMLEFGEDADRVLQTLLNWCVYVTKEEQLAHVVLGITDADVMSNVRYFAKNSVYNRVRFMAIGDVTDERADDFVRERAGALLDEDGRRAVVDAAGGRLCDARGVINDVRAGYAVDEAVGRAVQLHAHRTTQALLHSAGWPGAPDGGDDAPGLGHAPGPTSAPGLARAIAMLAEEPFVPYARMRAAFGGRDAELYTYVRGDVLGIRVGRSADMPGASENTFYVTAESPLARAAFRAMLADGSGLASEIREAAGDLSAWSGDGGGGDAADADAVEAGRERELCVNNGRKKQLLQQAEVIERMDRLGLFSDGEAGEKRAHLRQTFKALIGREIELLEQLDAASQ